MAEPRLNDRKRPRISVITDWRVRDEDLPDVAPGAEYECVIAPQRFVALCRIVVRDLELVRLQIGEVEAVPFELESADSRVRTYRLKSLNDEDLRRRFVETGGAVATSELIAVVPGLEIRMVLRNEAAVPAKPLAALLVHEEA